ncbi:MFS general substrate transporter [Mycena floridula]|nr:MFS general substrate transporter [Mycena floridula]
MADSETPPDIEKASVESEHPNTNGTFHQSQLGADARLKGVRNFFSMLDPAYALAVEKDALTVEYTEEEERKVRRKIDWRILPLVIGSFLCKDVFRSASICPSLVLFSQSVCGNAHVIDAFNENYEITSNSKWTLRSLNFLCLLEMPANGAIGANRFFFISLLFWGLSSISFVYAQGYAALLVLRVLLGIAEAGFYAGVIYYLSFWYERLSMTGTYPGLVAFGLVRAHTSVLVGWQFLFLIEGIPTMIMAVLILCFLPSFPFAAGNLTPRERSIAQARLNRDHRPQSHGGMSGWQGFKAVVQDPSAWMLMLIYASFDQRAWFSSINAQGLTAAPYAAGWFMVLFQAIHSDKTKDRGYHIMLSCAVSFIGYVILATSVQKSVGAAYFALFLVVGGNYSLFPLVMSWAANTFSPTSKRGVGTAFIVSWNLPLTVGAVYFDAEDKFRKGHAISAACLFLSFITAFILRTRLARLNKRNQKKLAAMTEEEKNTGDAEISDNDPRYVFIL